MARGKKLEKALPLEEMLELALVPEEEQPYEIPGNWCWIKFFAISTISTGKKDAKYGSIEGKYYFFTCASEPIRCDDYSFNCKAILLAGNGDISNISMYEGKFEAYQRTYVVQIKEPFMLEYMYYFFKYKWVEYNKDRMFGTAIPYIRLGNLQEFAIPVAPLPEQIRIVERIEKLFNQLEEAKAKIQSVRDGFEGRKAAILYRAFTGELIGIKNKGTVPLENIVDAIKIGPFGSALHKKDYISDGVPVINPKHICAQKIISEDKVSITIEKAKELQSYKLQENDIVMGRRGEMGRSAPVTKREAGWLCGTGSLIIRLKKGYIASFYSQIIASHSAVQYLEEHSVGSTMKNLNEKVIKSLPVPNYTIKQQKEIINVLDQILSREQQAKRITEIILTQMETLKKSILAQAFRGQLGTNDPIEKNICSYNLLEIL